MAPNDDLITGLMIRYARREKLTDEEMRILEEWWQQSPEHQRLAEQFGDEDWVRSELARMKPAPMREMWEGINKYLDEIGAPDDRAHPGEWERPASSELPGRLWTRPLAVAAVVFMCVIAVWMLVGKSGEKPAVAVVRETEPVAVAKEDGVLLLGSDGRTVDINAAAVGDTVVRMGNVYAKKLGADQLALYKVDESAVADGWQAVLVGKRRSPYFVRLTDGSNVWLDGGARLEYAVAKQQLAENYRFEGKAYFDVTKDKSRPFIISMADDRAIEVLGTSFNVEAGKEDRGSRVVLLNGALKVRNGAGSAILKAAQEAVLSPGKTDVRPMQDSGEVVAWVKKSLYFHFSNTAFTDAISEIASWYGYTVSNPKGLHGITITDNLRKDPSPEGVVFKIGEIENPYLYVWVNNKVIYISDKRTAIDR